MFFYGSFLLFVYCICVLFIVSYCDGNDDIVVWGSVEEDGKSQEPQIGSRFGEAGSEGEKDMNTTIIELFNNCTCVLYYQCDEDNYIITDGKGLIDIRANSNTERIQCPRQQYVCCKVRSSVEIDDEDPSSRNPSVPQSSSPRPDFSTIKSTRKYKCGVQRPTLNVRVFVDDDVFGSTMEGEFPWIVAVYKKKKSTGEYELKCGGSLIHPNVVLTATHCVKGIKAKNLKVLVNGKNELYDIGIDEQYERSISDVIKHPDYYSGGAYNDIALLILEEPYNISTALINTVCLPEASDTFDGQRCIAAGWGKGNNKDDKRLIKVEVPMVEFTRCQSLLRNTRLGESFNLHRSFICAGGEEGRDTCQGDGGAPLVCPIDNGERYVQVGIVSWGIGCAQKDIPGVYTNVALFRDWLNQELAKRSVNLLTLW